MFCAARADVVALLVDLDMPRARRWAGVVTEQNGVSEFVFVHPVPSTDSARSWIASSNPSCQFFSPLLVITYPATATGAQCPGTVRIMQCTTSGMGRFASGGGF